MRGSDLGALHGVGTTREFSPRPPHSVWRGGAGVEDSRVIHRSSTAHPDASVEMSPFTFSRNDSSVVMRSATRSQEYMTVV